MWEALWWLFVYVILPAGLGYLGGRLMAPDEPEAEERTEGYQSRSWDPRSTQQEGIPRPRALGENLHHGNIVGKWTDVANDREILYTIVEYGDGPTNGIGSNVVYLNDQPASNYGSVTVYERLGTMGQSVMPGFEQTKLEYKGQGELVKDIVQIFTTPNDFFDDIEYTVTFPNGIIHHHRDGDTSGTGVTLKVEISEHDAESWTTIFNEIVSGETYSPKFIKHTVSDYYAISRGTQYDMKFTRTSDPRTVDRTTDNLHLKSIREVIDVPFTRPGKALIGVKAIATAQLHGNLDVKVVREDRIINTYDGAVWTLEYSNNRAWTVWDVLTQPIISGNGNGEGAYVIERYEGIDPQYLDLEFFHTWSLFCAEEILDGYGSTEPRCACNTIIDAFTDVFSLAHKLAAVGRANLYWRGDKLTGWIDDVVTTPIDLVTMDSMMHKTWKNGWAIEEELAGVVEVFFKDSKQGHERTSAEYDSDEAGGYQNIVTVEGIGLTTRGSAIHYAKYLLERNRLIRNTNSFRVHKDGFRYKLGHVIRLQSKPANWGHAFRVVSSTADTITVDRDATTEVTVGDVLHIRSYDAVTEQPVTDSYEVDSIVGRVITATIAFDTTPLKGNLVATGAAGDIKLRRIIKLQATPDNYFDVTVETYDAELFDADDIDPDNPNINYIYPGPTTHLSDPVTRRELDDLVSQLLPPAPDINVPWPSNLTWTGSGGDTVTWSKTDGDDDITFRYAGTTNIITPDSTTLKYIYWDPDSPTVFLKTNLLGTALGAGHWLMAINEDGVVSTPNPQQIIHGGLIQAGTITAAYAQIANATIETAKIKDLNVTTAKVAGFAITQGASGYTAADVSVAGSTITLSSVAFTATGQAILVTCCAKAVQGAGTSTFTITVLRDAVTIYTQTGYRLLWGQGASIALQVPDTPDAGSYTYYFKMIRTAGTIAALVGNRSIYMREYKK